MHKFFCLCKTGLPLSNAAADALYQTAWKMLEKNQSSRRIYNDDIEGMVWTDFESAAIGGTAGIVFRGDVENKKGRTHVEYLVRTEDLEGLEDARWFRRKKKKKKNA